MSEGGGELIHEPKRFVQTRYWPKVYLLKVVSHVKTTVFPDSSDSLEAWTKDSIFRICSLGVKGQFIFDVEMLEQK